MKPNNENDKVCLVIPFHNEAKSVAPLLQEWINTLSFHKINFTILALNSGSTDDTRGVLRTLTETYPQLLLRDIEDHGHGKALMEGYRDAIQSDADWVFQCDSDGQIRPLEFLKFWDNRHIYETQIGYRAQRADGLFSSLFSKFNSKILSKMFGTYVLDINIPYRLIKRDLLSIIINEIPPTTFFPNIFISLLAAKTSNGFSQSPVVHRVRQFQHTLKTSHSMLFTSIEALLEIISFRFVFSSRVNDITSIKSRNEEKIRKAISK
ncbi:hypothetical protein A9Q84_18485 [Halobacteriovorax marinus]|uniref:Glycosyltransferase 2-like domain-containing protein n=1 Tax=Halobacteriovorax marinus TaxID=97084 RepID=A0A1Y5F2B6_9BACT|nr:hypothetical protein A9Q84_18485 [Halobacteriovorax marinus]